MKTIIVKFSLIIVMLTGISACGSSGSSGGGTTADTDTSGNAAAAISAVFSGGGEASMSASLFQKIQNMMVRLAHAQEIPDNCDEEEGASEDVIVGQDGTAGTYGPDDLAIAAEDFCANGGNYSTYEIDSASPVTFDCNGTTVVMIGGSGVWDSDADNLTTVIGSFTLAEDTAGTNSIEVHCSGSFTGTDSGAEDFDMNCEDEDGEAVTLLADAACTQAE